MEYPKLPNTVPLPYEVAPLPSNGSLPQELTNPTLPTPQQKSIFAFWLTGIETLPPYLLRNILNWHRRYSPLGWTVYVVDRVPGSPLNVSRFIDTSDPTVVPAAFTQSTLEGRYVAQHTSDLVRYPLLLKYGGIYLDAGILQFGDLEWLWTRHISNPKSPYDFAGFTMGNYPNISAVNFALVAGPDNPLVARAHYILLKIWEGNNNTSGSHKNPLVSHIPLMHVPQEVVVDDGGGNKMVINDEAMTDYAIQIQCMGSAQRWADPGDGWDGPKYVREKCWLLSMMDGGFAHEQMTDWSGALQHRLLCLSLPKPGEQESKDQALARSVVEKVVGEAWCLKLGHGFSAKLFGGDTLGMVWRKQVGSDCVEGTYAGWLRWAELNCKQVEPPKPMDIPIYQPTKTGKMIQYIG